ncbi:hypothetical protein AX15_002255 [Amanita polypyramis BW_CC]|nr:hypothetical protein AX15_002255 [Amanita polypyramis BW_CC]
MSVLPPQRPRSRSERLLRDTLRRDEEVRVLPSRKPSLSGRRSRVASPPPPPLPNHECLSRASSPPPNCGYAELVDEHYTRGTFLFRSAIANAPNSAPAQGYYPTKTDDMYQRSPRALHTQSTSTLTELGNGTATPGSKARIQNGNGSHTQTRMHSPRPSTRSISPSRSPTKGATVTRRHSLQRGTRHEPLTPQEHALRARLESVLRLEDNQQSSHMTWNPKEVRDGYGGSQQRDSDGRTRSGSLSQPQSDAFMLSTPPLSSASLHSGSSSSLQDHPDLAHVRSRSSTDPILTPSHIYTYHNSPAPSCSTSRARPGSTNTAIPITSSSSTPMSGFSPRRNAVASSHSNSHQRSRRKHNPMESTPPLTADASPTGIGEGSELEPDCQLGESRLITPPPSPPLPHANGTSHHQPHLPSSCRPMGDWYPAYSAEVYAVNRGTPTPHCPKPVRPQFNVRKASEQCKLIDGYVSFVSIEGLGGPPESNSPAVGDDEGEDEDRNRDKRMFGIGWDRWRKLLPLAVVGGTNVPTGGHEGAVTA